MSEGIKGFFYIIVGIKITEVFVLLDGVVWGDGGAAVGVVLALDPSSVEGLE